ncbi:hypothetical protein PHMEG_00018370 [Phytophthora megakarya]|uniref:Uncharacterized protein n=1 Tax=Phytophthora megakarya TaxID=4795 RepID=A0A225VVR9_9STRA|nr:hypothetical protein PHMEG_00018370 [Phytophthora megakarya]
MDRLSLSCAKNKKRSTNARRIYFTKQDHGNIDVARDVQASLSPEIDLENLKSVIRYDPEF